jgi:tetratricopeptide (TPR) repeat protein
MAILHVGEAEEFLYYVMELADPEPRLESGTRNERETSIVSLQDNGKQGSRPEPRKGSCYVPHTLRSELKHGGAMPVQRVLAIGQALAGALAHLHGQGLVHRDVKPSNVVFVNGGPKLADIGLVAEVGDARSYVGTEGYIPPEGPGLPSADCYSLGKVLYELSTGQDRTAWPQPPDDLTSRSDREQLLELNAILHRACAPNVNERYPDAAAMEADLKRLASGQSIRMAILRRKRLRLLKPVAMSMVLTGLLGGALFIYLPRDRYYHSNTPRVDGLVERGNAAVLQGTTESLRTALNYFNTAVELDSKCTPAYVGIFRTRLGQLLGFRPTPDMLSNLRAAATNLMKIGSSLAEARAADAWVKKELDGNWREALIEARDATLMRPASREGLGLVHELYGYALFCDVQPKEALREYQLAFDVFPTDPVIQTCLGHAYFALGDVKQALYHYTNATALWPGSLVGHLSASKAYEELLDFPNAIHELEESDQLSGGSKGKEYYNDLRQAFHKDGPTGYWTILLATALSDSPPDFYRLPVLLAKLRRMDEAYHYLEEACHAGKYEDSDIQFDSCWNRKDPKFEKLAKKYKLYRDLR